MLRPPSFYAAEGIELLTGTHVAAIDRAGRAIVLADGRRLPYDLLALTTGAVPRRLADAQGGSLAGVLLMRDLADADALAARHRARARGRWSSAAATSASRRRRCCARRASRSR